MKILRDKEYNNYSKIFKPEIFKHNFSVKATEFSVKPGCWNYTKVEIFDGDKKIGEYERNYSGIMETFVPFIQDGEWYALYSKRYTATRVMKLPECEDICGEEHAFNGFCPTEYYVPYNDSEIQTQPDLIGKFGFVAGCVWGDDSSYKVQFLDLSKIKQGKIIRDDRFGYLELPRNTDLKNAFNFYMEGDWLSIDISAQIHYRYIHVEDAFDENKVSNIECFPPRLPSNKKIDESK